MFIVLQIIFFFFFNDTATTEIYTLSLHDALPILRRYGVDAAIFYSDIVLPLKSVGFDIEIKRSEEHTSELQSLRHLVCRLLLEKKKKKAISVMVPLRKNTIRLGQTGYSSRGRVCE